MLKFRLLALALAAAVLSSCSASPPVEVESKPDAPSESAVGDSDVTDPTPSVEPEPACGGSNVRGSIPSKFSPSEVEDAYCVVADLTSAYAFVPELIRAPAGSDFSVDQFAGPRAHMSKLALSDWDAATSRIAKGKPKKSDFGDVWGLMYYSLYSSDYTYYPESSDEPDVLNLKVSPARAVALEDGRLKLTVTVTADLNFLDKKGKPTLFGVKKKLDVFFIRGNSKKGWLIDGWTANTSFPGPKPVNN